MIVSAVAFVAFAIGVWLLHAPIGGVIGFGMIAGATADFWMPVHFSLDGTKASRRCGISVTSIEWSEVKRADISEEGVKLSPLEKSSERMEPFRGVYLRFDGNRDQVIEAIRRNWNDDVRTLD
jgi:hypothetical protein